MIRNASAALQHTPGPVRALCILALLLVLAGCGPEAKPQDVAQAFWQAAIAGDRGKLAEQVRRADRERARNGTTLLPITQFTLARVVIERDDARIDTRVALGGDTPMNLAITTVLVREDGHWWVDYAATVRDIEGEGELAHMLDALRGLGHDLGAQVDRSVDELERALPALRAELEKLEKDVRAQLPELRKRLEDLTRELPRPPAPATPTVLPPPDTTRAI